MQGCRGHAGLGGNAVWWNVLVMKWVKPHTHTLLLLLRSSDGPIGASKVIAAH